MRLFSPTLEDADPQIIENISEKKILLFSKSFPSDLLIINAKSQNERNENYSRDQKLFELHEILIIVNKVLLS